MELLCKICLQWTKYRHQELKLTTVHDLSNHTYLKVFVPVPKDTAISQEQNEILEDITAW